MYKIKSLVPIILFQSHFWMNIQLTWAVRVVYGFSSPPGTWCCLTIDSTSLTNPTMLWYSLSASPKVAWNKNCQDKTPMLANHQNTLKCACASIKPWISSTVWTIKMSTRSSRVPSNQLLNGAARLANSRCKMSIFSKILSASSRACLRLWVRAPNLSHWSQIRWQRVFTLILSWYSKVLKLQITILTWFCGSSTWNTKTEADSHYKFHSFLAF